MDETNRKLITGAQSINLELQLHIYKKTKPNPSNEKLEIEIWKTQQNIKQIKYIHKLLQ